MEPDRWQQVKGALGEAMALSEENRAAYLERLGASDPALRAELESLLRAADYAASANPSSFAEEK